MDMNAKGKKTAKSGVREYQKSFEREDGVAVLER